MRPAPLELVTSPSAPSASLGRRRDIPFRLAADLSGGSDITDRSTRRRTLIASIGIAALAVTLVAPATLGAGAKTKRVSIPSAGGIPDGDSYGSSISADGRYVAFVSQAKNLIPNDGNAHEDIFVHDRKTKKTKRVSIPSGGGVSDSGSDGPSISANGRYVAFESWATNLIPNDGNAFTDVFVHDRKTKKTKRVSIPSGGGIADGSSFHSSISADGRYVAFGSDATNLIPNDGNHHADVFVHDRKKKKTKRVSRPNGGGIPDGASSRPSISTNGRFVAFPSKATNLIPTDGNSVEDIFVRGPLR